VLERIKLLFGKQRLQQLLKGRVQVIKSAYPVVILYLL
jgi:hypothetical protein